MKRESEVSSARVLAVTSNVSADQWRFVVLCAAELFGEPAEIPDTLQACVLKFIDAARTAGLNVNAGDLILPIVQTKRRRSDLCWIHSAIRRSIRGRIGEVKGNATVGDDVLINHCVNRRIQFLGGSKK